MIITYFVIVQCICFDNMKKRVGNMKKLKLIYNPYSGNKNFKYELDRCLEILQKDDFEVTFFRSTKIGDIDRYIDTLDINDLDAIVVSGGDGTINIVMNAIMRNGLQEIPVGIIPSGTANDFATFMKLPKDNAAECCKIIAHGNTKTIDLGLACTLSDDTNEYHNAHNSTLSNKIQHYPNKSRDIYFINVCAGGLFSNVSQNMDKRFKDMLGKVGYYIKGMEQLTGFKPIPMRITNSKEIIEDNINLFLVLNSSGTGGINGLSPQASIDDGMFDFVGFRNLPWVELPKLIVKFLKGEYLEDNNVIFFTDNYIKIENLDPQQRFSVTDCDGEEGPKMPVEIRNIHKCIKIFSK